MTGSPSMKLPARSVLDSLGSSAGAGGRQALWPSQGNARPGRNGAGVRGEDPRGADVTEPIREDHRPASSFPGPDRLRANVTTDVIITLGTMPGPSESTHCITL